MESYITIENYICTDAQSIGSIVCLSVCLSAINSSQVWYFIVWVPDLCLLPYYRYIQGGENSDLA